MRRFRANAVSAEVVHELNTFSVVLGERPDGSGMRLEIQKALSFQDQDLASGHDTYCLGTEEGATHYGGVTSWTIEPGALTLLLAPEAAEALGVDIGFLVAFPSARTVELKEALSRALDPTAFRPSA